MTTETMNKDFVLLFDMDKLPGSLRKKQRETAASDILLRRGLRIILGGESSYSLRYRNRGKPYFNEYPDIFFNISHSGQFAACAFSDHEVGLDLQMVPHMDNARLLKIARRFFSDADFQELSQASSAALPQAFTDMWAAHEAYVKLTGEGLSDVKEFSAVDGKIIREKEVKARYHFLTGLTGFSMVICRGTPAMLPDLPAHASLPTVIHLCE